MRRIIILAVVLGLLPGAVASAAEGVDFAITIHQHSESGPVLLLADTAMVVKGVTASGFLLSVGLDIELTAADSSAAQFMAHVVTLGPPAKTVGKQYSVEYGLPARIEGIPGKPGVSYVLALTPLGRREVDTAVCPFDHHSREAFRPQPSANMDLYVVQNSFADFNFQTFKGLLEYHYREFQDYFKFTLPGKFSVYLCPCAVPSVLWDQRYGQAVNPARSSAFVILTNGANSTDPFVVNHTALLRSWGYAPPFLSEGVSNYLTLAVFDMKKLFKAGQAGSLDRLLDTHAYLEADPVVSDRVSATFVKYLIDAYGLRLLQDLYEQAHDLNLRASLVSVYGRSINELEAGWRTYVDTVTIGFAQLVQEEERAKAVMNFDRMEEYAQAMLGKSQSAADSMFSLSNLKQARFFSGDYYGATEAARQHAAVEEGAARNWMSLAAYQMMNGLYAEARENLMQAGALDPSDQSVMFNLALNHLYAGDTARAESLLVEIVSRPEERSPQGESRVVLGELYRRHTSKALRERAATYNQEAMGLFQQQIETSPWMATAYLWYGAAALGFGDSNAARSALETALFLETRPFYVGLINLWLGKTADVVGDHETADGYYGRVVAGASAAYTQQEASRLAEHPYTIK